MRFSRQLVLVLALTIGLAACAHVARIPAAVHKSVVATKNAVLPSRKRKKQPVPTQPPYAAQTATLDVTFGLHVIGVVPLPEDFEPDPSRAPVWLSGGSEIGVIGIRAGKGAMLGFSGMGLSRQRIVVEDNGPGAMGGRLLDVAVNTNGRLIAIAAAAASGERLDVNLADAASTSQVDPIANIEGEFDSAQLIWLSSGTIALAAHAVATPEDPSNSTTAPVAVGGLYLVTPGGSSTMKRLENIKCTLSPLAFSPDGAYAVPQGAVNAAPAIIDIHDQNCSTFPSMVAIQVLSWAPDSRAFLYRTAEQSGVFRFNLKTRQISTIAISSGAAAYASDGTIIAFGSQELSWHRAMADSTSRVKAQIALLDPHQNLTTINSLGFKTQPALLAQSTMVFSPVSNDAIIDTAIPDSTGLSREIIEYSYPARAGFILAHGRVRGSVAISWSPDGKQIAIIDGDPTRRTLAVIQTPR